MLTLRQFIKEELVKSAHLLHLEHPEDLHIDHGEQGLHHAVGALKAVNDKLKGKFNKTKVTEKYDGSPSVVFGHDPKTGKFFVATKSAFNKDPKINYTVDDIKKNHGHAPGLVQKLTAALEHLPKIAPKTGVYQGDIMHTRDDVHEHKGEYNFTPNTIMYTSKKNSEEGKKIGDSQIGIVVHSKYTGPSLSDMKVGFDPDLHNFKDHKDVHRISPEVDVGAHEASNEASFDHHIKRAEKEFETSEPGALETVSHHAQHIKTYINKTVRDESTPTTAGYRKHIMDIGSKEAEGVKTAKSKQEKLDKMVERMRFVDNHENHFDKAFKIHHHVQKAKDALVKSLSSGGKFEYSYNGKSTKPEGHVVVHEGHPLKLVDRKEFSKNNFEKNRG